MYLVDRYINFIYKRYPIILTVLLIATVFFGFYLRDLRYANAFEGWIERDNPAIEEYREFLSKFKSSEAVVLAVETEEGVFTPEVLLHIDNLTKKIISRTERVVDVFSLTNISVMRSAPIGVKFSKLMERPPETQEQADMIRREVLDNPVITENFLSKDEKSTIVAIFIGRGGPDYSYIPRDIKRIRQAMAEEEAPGINYHLAGGLVLNQEMNRLTRRQAYLFAPIVFVVATLLLLLILKSVKNVILVQLCTFSSLLWAVGLYVGTGHSINFLMVALPPLVLVISVADAVHILIRYREECEKGLTPWDAVGEAVRGTIHPCLYTSLATAAGFGVLIWSGIPVIKTFGMFAAAGILMAFVVSVTMIPALLLLLISKNGKPVRIDDSGNGPRDMFEAMLIRIHGIVMRRPGTIIALGIAVFAVSIHGISRIVTDTNNLAFFSNANHVRQDMQFIEDNLLGLSTIEFMFSAEKGHNMVAPVQLQAMLDLEKFMKEQPEVTNVISIADHVLEMNRVMTGRGGELPGTGSLVSQLIRDSGFLKMRENRSFLKEGGRYARMSVRMRYLSTKDLRALVERIEGYLEEHKSPEYEVFFTGGAPVYLEIANTVLMGQIRSFVLVICIVTVMMILLFRSLSWGILGMIPSVIPVLLVMGVMGWSGIPLNLATMMIASISIGIAVDDTMHMMARCRREILSGCSYEEATRRAMKNTGVAVIATTLVLVSGFGVLVFSSFMPIRHFGLLSAITMVAALVLDLFLLTPLLVIFKPGVRAREISGSTDSRPGPGGAS